jgi:Condensation domain
VRVGEDEYVVLFTMHHIVSDAWSKSVLVREVVALYKAFIQGRPSPLAELPIQYADYAVWQREWLQGEALEKQLAYWRERLGGKLPTLELPTDRQRPAALSYHGARHYFMLEEGLTAGLKELSRSSGATLFMTLLAGFKTLLYRETGQEDLLIGTAIAGRNRSETEGLIGFFINTLALRTDLSGAPKFTDLLAQVKRVALGAYAHQDLPFDKLVEDLQPERSASRAPIVQVTFGLMNAPRTELELPGLTFSALGIERETGRYDVTLWMSEVGGQLSGTWRYMTELYDLETIERLTGRFETLLRSVVAQPEARLHTLEMLTEAEKQELGLKKKRRQVPQVDKLKGVKKKSIGVSSELPEAVERR